MIKQTIYSSSRTSVKGNSIGFQFITYSNNLSSKELSILEKNNYYYRPSYLTNEAYSELNKTNYPVRYQYTKIDNLFVLAKTKYIGQEQTSNREGNFLSHQLIKDTKFVSSPVKYFLAQNYFIEELPSKYLEINTNIDYLEDINDTNIYNNNYSAVCGDNYIISLLNTVLDALKNNKKIVIKNNDNPLELINDLSLLLPISTVSEITFNTYIDNNNGLNELINFIDKNNENVSIEAFERMSDVIIFSEENHVNPNYHLVRYLMDNGINANTLSSLSEFYLLSNNKGINHIDSLIPVVLEEKYSLNNIDDVKTVVNEISQMNNEGLLKLITNNYLEQVLINNDYTLLKTIFEMPGFNQGIGAGLLVEYFKDDFIKNEENIFWISALENLLNDNIFDLNYVIEILSVFNDDYYLSKINLNNMAIILKMIYQNNEIVLNNNFHLVEYYLDKIYQNTHIEEVKTELDSIIELFDQNSRVINQIVSTGKMYGLDDSHIVSFMEDVYLETILYNKVESTLNDLNSDDINLEIYYQVLTKYFGILEATKMVLSSLKNSQIYSKYTNTIIDLLEDSSIVTKDKVSLMEVIFNNSKLIENFSMIVSIFTSNINIVDAYSINKKLINELFKDQAIINNDLNLNLYYLLTNKIDSLNRELTKSELLEVINYLFDNEKSLLDRKVLTYYFNTYDKVFNNLLIVKFNSDSEKERLIENFIKVLDSLVINDQTKKEIYITLISLLKISDNKKKTLIDKRVKLK